MNLKLRVVFKIPQTNINLLGFIYHIVILPFIFKTFKEKIPKFKY